MCIVDPAVESRSISDRLGSPTVPRSDLTSATSNDWKDIASKVADEHAD